MSALLELPIRAIELSAFGGTNFSQLEWQRAHEKKPLEFTRVGHSPEEMIHWINELGARQTPRCQQFIISGGIRTAF